MDSFPPGPPASPPLPAGALPRVPRGRDPNSLVFLVFAFSFSRPRSTRDWRSFGGFAAFDVALFTEMYGVPLTIYLLWGWLAGRVDGLDLLSHDAGHLWQTLLEWKGDSHARAAS